MAQPSLAVVPQDTAGEAMPDIQQHQKLLKYINATNIAEDLDESLLSEIGARAVKEYEIDDTSRSEWKNKTEQAMELAMQVAKEKQFPWPKAANVIWPLMTTASIQFAARAYPAIVQNRNVVKGVVIGSDDGEPQMAPDGTPAVQQAPNGQVQPVWKVPPGIKQSRADGIAEHMSWQLLDEMPEWEPETDTLLHVLPIVGCHFRKTYFDPGEQRNMSLCVWAKKLIINYKAKSLETAPRITEELEFYPNEIEEHFRSGLWLEQEFGPAKDAQDGDDDAPHQFLEQHRYLDLDEDGYKEPYIVTVHKESRKVVRIVARYDADGITFSHRTHKIVKIKPIQYYTKYDFLPNPDGGIYGVGFGQLLRPLNEAINTTLNQLLDAGTLQNTGGGFIAKGLSMNAGAIRFVMGEYKVVNVAGGTLRENIVPMQFPGPSPVLFQLLGMLVEAGKEVAAIKDILTGDSSASANTPATTTLALIEQGLKVFTAIYKRIHRALKQELNKLYDLNRKFGDERSEYKVGDTWKQITRQDYVLGSGVEPVSDPTMVSDMQRLGRAQFLMQFAGDPMCNPLEIRRRMFTAANIDQIDKILVTQPPTNPAIAVKGMELDLKHQEVVATVAAKKAAEVRDYSQAILNLANADATVGDQHLQWLDQQLTVWEKQFEAAQQPPDAESGQSGGMAPASPPPPGLPHPIQVQQPQMPNTGPTINPHNPGASIGVAQ